MTNKDDLNAWMKLLRDDAPASAAFTVVERLLAFIVADLPPEHAVHVTRSFAVARAAQELGACPPRPFVTTRSWEDRVLTDGMIVGPGDEDADPDRDLDDLSPSNRPKTLKAE